MQIYIETKRLILREFVEEDINELHNICSQTYILKWMPDWERTIEERMGWLAWIQENYTKATKTKARVMLAVTTKNDEKLIGMTGIGNKDEVDDEIELAYFISEQYSGKGYISEAAKAMVDWTFDILEPDYLMAIVERENIASKRVLEKCGFHQADTRMILNSGEAKEKPFYYFRLDRKKEK